MSKLSIFLALTFALLVITYAQDAPDGWILQWSDEFDGPSVDQTKWSFEIGNGNGWGNNELEYYTGDSSNVFIQDGKLVIQANKEDKDGFQYTSTRMKTQGKFSTVYGWFEASIKLPVGQGMWPAFWMLGENIAQVGWPACGEIDIMEAVGYDPLNVHGSTHGPGFDTTNAFYSDQGFSNDFHTYKAIWQPDYVEFYVDDQMYAKITPADTNGQPFVFNGNPMFILLNLAVGGNWPGAPDASTQFPQQMIVDYVRVYQRTSW